MKNYWNNLNDREKWTLVGGMLCLFLYLYYLFLYSPLSNSVSQKSKQLIEKAETLKWMKSVQGQVKPSKTKQTVSDNQVLTLLSSQLNDNKTFNFPFQLQQTGSGNIQLSFAEAPFNLFMNWLSTLNENYTIEIMQFNVEPTPTPGVVKLMIIMSGV